MGTDIDPLRTRRRRTSLAIVIAVLAAVGLVGAGIPVAAAAPGADGLIAEAAMTPATALTTRRLRRRFSRLRGRTPWQRRSPGPRGPHGRQTHVAPPAAGGDPICRRGPPARCAA